MTLAPIRFQPPYVPKVRDTRSIVYAESSVEATMGSELLDVEFDVSDSTILSSPSTSSPLSVPGLGEYKSQVARDVVQQFGDVYSDVPPESFRLLSTIRYDPSLRSKDQLPGADADVFEVLPHHFFLLRLHYNRVVSTVEYFRWNINLGYDLMVSEATRAVYNTGDTSRCYKLRMLLSYDGELVFEASPIMPLAQFPFAGFKTETVANEELVTVYLDSNFVLISPFTSFKTTRRVAYDEAYVRTVSEDADRRTTEVLLHNARQEVTEGTITNVAFWRDGHWVTPPLSSGCLAGVMRQYLLIKKFIIERMIDLSSVEANEPVLLFNAVQGVRRGVIRTEVL